MVRSALKAHAASAEAEDPSGEYKIYPAWKCILYIVGGAVAIKFGGEENGVSYYFCDEDTVEKLEAEGKIIELRAYHTIHGIWKYFTVADHQVDLDHQSYLLIGTLESYLKIREYFGTESVVPIYIEVEDGMRLQRALERERRQENPKYEELCRRFLADEKDFSEEKLKEAGITKRFCNESLEETENAIAAYIEEQE